MTKRITQEEIKKDNRKQIYQYIYNHSRVSSQVITRALDLSRPTVAANLNSLEENGLICKNGLLSENSIGRKASAYSIVSDYRIAVGVEILHSVVHLIATDLYGRKVAYRDLPLLFSNEHSYYRSLCESVQAFINSLPVSPERVLGIGISMQGLPSPDGRSIVYGEILGCTGVKTDVFQEWLAYPCSFLHDPDAAALSEILVSPELVNAIYISLSRHLGGSLILNRQIMTGKHGHNATFEHAHGGGNLLCYCGKRGCWDTLCSMKALLGDEDPAAFFQKARNGSGNEAEKWNTFLKNLANLIEDLHLTIDMDIILGGPLAQFIIREDIDVLYREIETLCPFREEKDYILISKMPSHNIVTGLSLPYIYRFLDEIDNGI